MRGGGLRGRRTVQPRMVKDGEYDHMGEELMKEEDKNEGLMKRERGKHEDR